MEATRRLGLKYCLQQENIDSSLPQPKIAFILPSTKRLQVGGSCNPIPNLGSYTLMRAISSFWGPEPPHETWNPPKLPSPSNDYMGFDVSLWQGMCPKP